MGDVGEVEECEECGAPFVVPEDPGPAEGVCCAECAAGFSPDAWDFEPGASGGSCPLCGGEVVDEECVDCEYWTGGE